MRRRAAPQLRPWQSHGRRSPTGRPDWRSDRSSRRLLPIARLPPAGCGRARADRRAEVSCPSISSTRSALDRRRSPSGRSSSPSSRPSEGARLPPLLCFPTTRGRIDPPNSEPPSAVSRQSPTPQPSEKLGAMLPKEPSSPGPMGGVGPPETDGVNVDSARWCRLLCPTPLPSRTPSPVEPMTFGADRVAARRRQPPWNPATLETTPAPATGKGTMARTAPGPATSRPHGAHDRNVPTPLMTSGSRPRTPEPTLPPNSRVPSPLPTYVFRMPLASIERAEKVVSSSRRQRTGERRLRVGVCHAIHHVVLHVPAAVSSTAGSAMSSSGKPDEAPPWGNDLCRQF